MTKEQVALLREMGISEKEIIDRILQETADAVSPESQAAKMDPPQLPEAQPEAPKDPAPQPDREDAILAAIEKLTGAIFAQNGRSIGRETADDQNVEKILDSAFYQPGGV